MASFAIVVHLFSVDDYLHAILTRNTQQIKGIIDLAACAGHLKVER
jgi:hypothetical protein